MAGPEHPRTHPHCSFKYLSGLAVLAGAIFCLNKGLLVFGFDLPPFFRFYLGDVLALPVYVPLSMILARKLDLVAPDFLLSLGQIVLIVVVFSGIFEGLVPLLGNGATRDPFDALAYLVGGLGVYGVQELCKGSTKNTKRM